MLEQAPTAAIKNAAVSFLSSASSVWSLSNHRRMLLIHLFLTQRIKSAKLISKSSSKNGLCCFIDAASSVWSLAVGLDWRTATPDSPNVKTAALTMSIRRSTDLFH